MNAMTLKTKMLATFDKTPKWLTKFFYSDLYLGLLAGVILASWISGIMLIGIIATIVIATILLVVMDDIMPLIPLLFYVAFCVSDLEELLSFFPLVYCVIPLAIAIIFHLIVYRPTHFSFGELGISQIFVSIALIVSGCTCITLERWTGALPYSILLGVGVLFIYLLWTNYTKGSPHSGAASYIAKVMMWMGLILVGEIVTYYIRNRIGTPISEWSSYEVINFGWGIDNSAATLLLLSAPMCFYLATKKEHPTPFILIGTIHYLGIVAVYSRGGLLFAVITAPLAYIFAVLCSKNKSESLIIVLCIIIIGLTAFAFLYDKVKTVLQGIFADGIKSSTRILLYEDALAQFVAHPIFGVGIGYDGPDYDNFVESITMYRFHSTLFQVIGSMGIVGILAYAFNYIKRAKIVFKHILKDKFILFAFLSLIGFELYSLIDTGTFIPIPMMIVFVILAIVEKHHKEQIFMPEKYMHEKYDSETFLAMKQSENQNDEQDTIIPAGTKEPQNAETSQAEVKNV